MSKAEIAEVQSSWLHSQRKPDVPQGKIFDAWQLRIKAPDEVESLNPTQRLGYFAWLGGIAPWTHNYVTHRYRFDERRNGIELLIDKAGVLPESDPEGRQVGVSLGCTIENIRGAAVSYGLAPRFERTLVDETSIKPLSKTDENPYVSVGTIYIPDGPVTLRDQKLLEAMLERKIVRSLYDHSELNSSTTEMLQTIAREGYPTLRLHLLTDAQDLHALGKSQAQADKQVYDRKKFLEELGTVFHPNKDNESYRGMRGREFGFDDDSAQRFHEGFNLRTPFSADEIAGFAKSARDWIKSSSAVGIITVTRDIPTEHIKAGRLYEELALALHMRDYCTAVHAATTETHRPGLQVRALLDTDRTPVMVFRIGMPQHPDDRDRMHSSRPPLDTLILP